MRIPWRLLRTAPAPGARNMAVDEALLESVRNGGAPTLRLYEWSPPCLSLGRNQPAVGHYPAAIFEALGVDIVRRSTGGRAVLHHGELTYSVVAADRAFGSPRRAYHLINQVLVAAIASLGGDAGVLQATTDVAAAVPSTTPCFAEPAAGEVLAGGRKMIGSAQLRVEGVILQHGSTLLRRSPLLDALAAQGIGDLEGTPAYLQEVLGRPLECEALPSAVVTAWERAVGRLEEIPLRPVELARADAHEARFLDDDWTWRR